MTMMVVAREEPAIYKVLHEQATPAVRSARVGKLREFVVSRREKVRPQDALHLPYVGMEQVEAHTMRLLGTVEASSMKSSANRFFPGDVLYGRLRPYLNKVYLATFEGICSPEFIVIPRTTGLDPRYLRYRLNAHDFVSFARHLNAGDRPRVDFEQISEFTVALPPEDQQAQTVAYLDEQLSRLDASVAALHRVRANLKRYTKSLIQSLTDAGASSTWCKVSVDDIAQSLDNMRIPVNKTERALRGGSVPYLGANGQTGWIDKPLFNEELVLVVEDETFVGRTQPFCYYFAGKCWVNNHTHVLRAKPGLVTPQYLNFALSYYPFIPLTTGSTGRRKLTKKALMAAPLSLPPLTEQHRIVAEADRRLSLIRVAEAQVSANLARAQRLRQSILQAAFSLPVQTA